jgi:hypothetical protein
VASSLTVRACVRSADSRVVCSAWVGVKLLRGSCSSLENLNFFIVLFISRPESRQGYPPNLSILISGGKENNRDTLSNGE